MDPDKQAEPSVLKQAGVEVTVPPSPLSPSLADFVDRSLLGGLGVPGLLAATGKLDIPALVLVGVVAAFYLVTHSWVTVEKIRAGVAVKR